MTSASVSGVTNKDVDQYAEDLLALAQRSGAYNYIHDFQGRSGWLVLENPEISNDADSPMIREYSMSGLFLPRSRYQARFHSSPQIRTNPWGLTLGADDCDNYVALPAGASYSGGDGTTTTRESEDGTITLVLATTDGDVCFDVGESEVDLGEVKVLDPSDEEDDDYWLKVHSPDLAPKEKLVLQNGLYRVILDADTEYITLYRWDSGTSVYVKIDDFTAGTFTEAWLSEITPDQAVCKLDNGVEITVRRGHPILIDTGATDLSCVSSTPADQSTSTDNYLSLGTSLYICSDATFSLVNSTKNLDSGKKWIFYEAVAATAEDIAHQCLVLPRLKRELVAR